MARTIMLPGNKQPYSLAKMGGALVTLAPGQSPAQPKFSKIEYHFGPEGTSDVLVRLVHVDGTQNTESVERVEEHNINEYLIASGWPEDITPPPSAGKKVRKARRGTISASLTPSAVCYDTAEEIPSPGVPTATKRDASLLPGTRVCVNLGALHRNGTIYRPSKGRRDEYVICLDRETEGCSVDSKILGRNRGVVASSKSIELRDQEDERSWTDLPSHVAVFVRQKVNAPFITPLSTVGRILRTDGKSALCVWFASPKADCSDGSVFKDWTGKHHQPCWWTDLKDLNFCTIDVDSKVILHIWPTPGEAAHGINVNCGDIVEYSSSRATRFGDGHSVCRGTILRVEETDGRSATVSVLGGCPRNVEGTKLRVPLEYLSPFKPKWIKSGIGVEITANITFKKLSLQGRKGMVLTSTDPDGDIGVEFSEDLGAGSLDGVGKDGHCLYVSSEAVKVSE